MRQRIAQCLLSRHRNHTLPGTINHHLFLRRYLHSTDLRPLVFKCHRTHLPQVYLSVPRSPMDIKAYAITGRLSFKDSPFYTILEPLTSTMECKSESCNPITFITQLKV